MNKIESTTKLRLIRDWDAPTHFFPKGIVGSVSYFSTLCGLSAYNFIERYENFEFLDWFEIIK